MVDGTFNITPIGSMNNVKKIDPTTKDENNKKKKKKKEQQHSVEEDQKILTDENETSGDSNGIDILA